METNNNFSKLDEQSKLSYLEKWFKTSEDYRRKFEESWFANIAYLAGNQWSSFRTDVLRFRKDIILPDNSLPKLTINKIYPIVRQAIAYITGALSEIIVQPASEDSNDIESATIATDFIKWRNLEDKETDLLNNELLWIVTCGQVYRKTYYDPNKTDLGDICTESLNPFQYYITPGCASNEFPPYYVIETSSHDVDWVKEQYGKEVIPDKEADAHIQLDKLLSMVVTQSSNFYGTGNSAGSQDTINPITAGNNVLVKTIYFRPSTMYPKGHIIVWVRGKILKEYDLDGIYPFTAINWFDLPGAAYPAGLVEFLRPLQKEYNITRSQLMEVKNRQLRLDYITRGYGEIEEKIYNKATGAKQIILPPGIVDYKILDYSVNAQQANEILMDCWQSMQDIAAVHDISLGRQIPGEMTASEILTLRDANSAGLDYFRNRIDHARTNINRTKLDIAKEYYEVPRLARISVNPEKGLMRSLAIKGSDLRGYADIVPISRPMITPTMLAQLKIQAQQMGLLRLDVSLGEQYANRLQLVNMGLLDLADELEAILPMSDLKVLVKEEQAVKAALEIETLKANLQGLQQQQTQMEMAQAQQAITAGMEATQLGEQLADKEAMDAMQLVGAPTAIPAEEEENETEVEEQVEEPNEI